MSTSTIKSLSTTLSTVDKVPGPALLHPFPIQHWSMFRGPLTVVHGAWTRVQGWHIMERTLVRAQWI
ncbi:hypothetical protein N8310_05400 [Pseudomonadota bacterium]|nr:hypothetical protein [Pseudomonadota bacterium]